jgi:hypothetical protein
MYALIWSDFKPCITVDEEIFISVLFKGLTQLDL